MVAQKRTIPCDQNALITKMIIKINFKYVTTKKVHKDSVLLIYHCKTLKRFFYPAEQLDNKSPHNDGGAELKVQTFCFFCDAIM